MSVLTTTNTGAALAGGARPEEGSRMKMKIVHDCIVNGKYAHVGDIVDVDEKAATSLVGFGRAVKYTAAAKTEKPKQEKAKD